MKINLSLQKLEATKCPELKTWVLQNIPQVPWTPLLFVSIYWSVGVVKGVTMARYHSHGDFLFIPKTNENVRIQLSRLVQNRNIF